MKLLPLDLANAILASGFREGSGTYMTTRALRRADGRKEAPHSQGASLRILLLMNIDYSMSHPSGGSSGMMSPSVGVPVGTMKVARITASFLPTLRTM